MEGQQATDVGETPVDAGSSSETVVASSSPANDNVDTTASNMVVSESTVSPSSPASDSTDTPASTAVVTESTESDSLPASDSVNTAASNAVVNESTESQPTATVDTASTGSAATTPSTTPSKREKVRSVKFMVDTSDDTLGPAASPSAATAVAVSTSSSAATTSESPSSKGASPKGLEKSLSRVSSMQANRDASVLISRLQNDIKDLLVSGNESSDLFVKGIFPEDEAGEDGDKKRDEDVDVPNVAVVESFGEDLTGLLDTSSNSSNSNNSSPHGLKKASTSNNLSRTMTRGTLLMNENLSLQAEARERNIMIEELRSKVDMLSTILTDSVEKTEQMERELQEQYNQIGQLQENEILLKKENLMLSKKISEQGAEIQQSHGIRSKMVETEAVMTNLQDEMVGTLENLLTTRQELKQLEDIDALRLQEIAAYNREIEDLKQELDAKRHELSAAEDANLETRTSCERSIALTERKMEDLTSATEMIRLENLRAKEHLLRVKGAQEKWEQEKVELQKSIDAWKRMSVGTVSTPKASTTTVSPLRRGNSMSSVTAAGVRSPQPTLPRSESTDLDSSSINEQQVVLTRSNSGSAATSNGLLSVDTSLFANYAAMATTVLMDSAQRTYLSVAEVIASGDNDKMKNELIGLAHQLETMRSSNARLLNKLQAARGNIQVCCRARPPNAAELSQLTLMQQATRSKAYPVTNKDTNRVCVLDVLDDNELACYEAKSEQWRSFAFDRVWKMDSTQAEVFADVEPLVMSVTEGYNCCLMAYGQTGSGKTFTMNGIGEDYGISYRTLSRIFEALELKRESAMMTARRIKERTIAARQQQMQQAHANQQQPQQQQAATPDLASELAVMIEEDNIIAGLEVEPFSYKVEISIMEVYNDQIHDLLVNNMQSVDGNINTPSLDVRQTPDGSVFVPGLIQVRVHSLEDVMAVFGRGSANRMTATTNLNERSSRSHLILQVTVTTVSEDELPVRAKLSLVDLAGSERVSKSGSVGSTMKEAQHINKSLSALGDVMEALDQKHKHIPYRNSKLTYLLNDSLGGNSRTMMIVTLCPTELTTEETLFSLHFATRVRNITIGAARKNVNAKNLEDALKSIKMELRDTRMKKSVLEEQVLALKREVKSKSERTAIQLDSKTRTLDDTKKYADIQIQQYSRQNRELMTRLQEEKTERSQVSLELSATKRDLGKYRDKIKEISNEREILQRELKHKDREIAALRQRLPQSALTGLSPTRSPHGSAGLGSSDVLMPPSPRSAGTSPERDSPHARTQPYGFNAGPLSPRMLQKQQQFQQQLLQQQQEQAENATPSREREEIVALGERSTVSVGNLIARYSSKGGSTSDTPIHLESYTHPTLVNVSPESARVNAGSPEQINVMNGHMYDMDSHHHLTLNTHHSDLSMSTGTPIRPTRGANRSNTHTPTLSSESSSSPMMTGYQSYSSPAGKQIIVGANGGATPASANYKPKMTPRSKEALLKHQVGADFVQFLSRVCCLLHNGCWSSSLL
jgi:hypothetical protein